MKTRSSNAFSFAERERETLSDLSVNKVNFTPGTLAIRQSIQSKMFSQFSRLADGVSRTLLSQVRRLHFAPLSIITHFSSDDQTGIKPLESR